MRALLMKGQERIHFHSERDARRKLILSELAKHRLDVLVIGSKCSDDRRARAACIAAIPRGVDESEPVDLVIELDESVSAQDASALAKEARSCGDGGSLSFELLPPRQDRGLWVADAFAWVANRSDDWVRRMAMHPTERLDAD
jgi:hypothetical protein